MQHAACSTQAELSYHVGLVACAFGTDGACEAIDAVDGAIERGLSKLSDLIAPGASGKGRSPNQRQNAFTDRLAKKYKLNDEQKRILHDEITQQSLSESEIDQIAQDIATNMPKGGQSGSGQ